VTLAVWAREMILVRLIMVLYGRSHRHTLLVDLSKSMVGDAQYKAWFLSMSTSHGGRVIWSGPSPVVAVASGR